MSDLSTGKGEISDGYHTFNELYEHRRVLFKALGAMASLLLFDFWVSKLHSDGTMFDGYFITGIRLPYGMVTYHYPIKYYTDFVVAGAFELDKAPEHDGHTSQDVIERLNSIRHDTI